MADIKVRDNEYTQAADALGTICGQLTACMDGYCAAVQYIKDNAIKDVLIDKELAEIKESVMAIRAKLESGVADLQSNCGEYVQQIDEADTYLY